MAVKVTRTGGIMARAPKERTFALDDLDPATKEALGQIQGTPRTKKPAMPDAYTYTFEIDGETGPKKAVEFSGPEVPNALRKLLPQ